MKNGKIFDLLLLLLGCGFIAFMIAFPNIALNSAKKGLILCSEIIIPSLFPVNFTVIFIMKLLERRSNGKYGKIFIFAFSLIGGYPTGSKLIDEEYKSGNIDLKTARIMQCYCVNAGAGFIISSVGYGIFGSKKLGLILFLSHCLASAVLGIILNIFFKNDNISKSSNKSGDSLPDIFVSAASEASGTILSICSFVILFSVVNGILLQNEKLKYLCFFTEITSALTVTKNIYLASFLLSFGGISIFMQIAAVSKNVGVGIKNLLLSRVFCGCLSALFTFLTTKIFKITVNVFSSFSEFTVKTAENHISVSISLAIMVVLLIISVEGKKIGGNLKDDLLK